MKLTTVLLIFVVGCRFELPQAGIDAPVDTQGDAGIDAPPDAPGCPANYAPLAGGPAGHVYRKTPLPNASWSDQFDFCRGTSARAYLAVPNDATELMNLKMLATPNAFWVGIDDRVTEGAYISAETGGPATFLPWAVDEPGPEDCIAAGTVEIFDLTCDTFFLPAACECNP